jgi:hypothetical protein
MKVSNVATKLGLLVTPWLDETWLEARIPPEACTENQRMLSLGA